MSDFMAVRNYSDFLQAGMARELLESNQINCYLNAENHSFMNWIYITSLGGMTLYVEKNRVQYALELISVFESETTPASKETCPHCGSTDTEDYNPLWLGKLLWTLLSTTPAHYRRGYRTCRSCGGKWNEESDD
ncbi:MAG: hypothetical protein ACLFVE_08410 [Chitinispirillaceae bacterium]